MKISTNNQPYSQDKSIWTCIEQYSLSEDTCDENSDAELIGRRFYETMQAAGVQPEVLTKIEKMIIETAKEARRQRTRGTPNLPVHIHILCQSIAPDGLHLPEKLLEGGWGYYVITRGRDCIGSDSPNISCRYGEQIIELYLYKEGK